jgi:phenylalanyl-tRNA synthetase beta chain
LQLAGGRVCGDLSDDNHVSLEVMQRGSLYSPVETTLGFINGRLGLSLNSDEVRKILTNVEFKVEATGEKLKVTAPFWRTDIEIPEDIVEEVGRLYGYDKLPLELPRRDLTPAKINETLAFKSRLREILAKAGANEVLNYSFVHGNLLEKVGQDKNLAFKINNAISPDLQYYRLSLTPSLLEKVHPNIKAGFKDFAIYEINKTHNKEDKDSEEPNIPREYNKLALVFASSGKANAAAFYHARKILDYVGGQLGLKFDYAAVEQEASSDYFVTQPFERPRTAIVIDQATSKQLGYLGEYKPTVMQSLKLPKLAAGFEIDLDILHSVSKSTKPYKMLSKFPNLEQDITLRSPAEMPYARLVDFMEGQLEGVFKLHGYTYELLPLDIFQKDEDKDHKQTTWRIILAHPERTLTTIETNELLGKIAAEAKDQLNAERI